MELGSGFPSTLDGSIPRPTVFGQQVIPSGANMNDNSGTWLQTTPAHMPWGITQPSLVHFTGEPTAMGQAGRSGFYRNFPYSHIKRKMEPETDVMPQPKLHITEEKMAAHLSQLHISPPEPMGEQRWRQMEAELMIEDEKCFPDTEADKEKEKLKRLYLCEEIKRYRDEILPSSILCKLQKPSTALMLWQPPAGILSQPLTDSVSRDTVRRAMEDERRERQLAASDTMDNNNSTSVDLNTLLANTYTDAASSITDEMDL